MKWAVIFILFIFAILALLQVVSAAHYITGIVNNATGGVTANGKTVMLWQPVNGVSDNVTDIIGPLGDSGANNTYLIDCELLSDPCDVGDEVAVAVIDDGDGYVSKNATLIVTGAGFDVMSNLTLNSKPSVTLNSPSNSTNISMNIIFNCSASDFDSDLMNITLYGNWSSGWHANETKNVSGGNASVTFNKTLPDGSYLWSCLAYDELNVFRFGDNFTLTVDGTAPNISAVYGNMSGGCSGSISRIFCNVSDSGLRSVLIQAWNASNFERNYTAIFLDGSYYADVSLNETGEWSFGCWANDSAGNYANKSGASFSIYGPQADLVIENITFGNNAPLENEIVQINASVKNNGCNSTGEFLVGFFRGDPDSGTQINGNVSISLAILERLTVNVNWTAIVGNSSIFASADRGNDVSESNETNNKNNRSIDVLSWMYLYGNISLNKVLATYLLSNLSYWSNESNIMGNIFITDKENSVSWSSLQAIGVNASGNVTSSDFGDIDILLGMIGFNDSVSSVFEVNFKRNYTVYQRIISNVSSVNSTNNSFFYTGILWDMSDDSNGEYDTADKEDLVFVAEVNKGGSGAYGVYDYEIRIPARLRNYRGPDIQDVYLYYELN